LTQRLICITSWHCDTTL